jgi:hypothetical protein
LDLYSPFHFKIVLEFHEHYLSFGLLLYISPKVFAVCFAITFMEAHDACHASAIGGAILVGLTDLVGLIRVGH